MRVALGLLLTLISCLTLIPCQAMAQGPVELTATAGYRWGGEILAEDNDLFAVDVDVEDSESFGLMLDIPITRSLQLELLADRQAGQLGERQLFGSDDIADIDITYYHVGVLWQWQANNLRPYIVGSIGMTEIDPDLPGVGAESRFSASFGGGIKLDFNRHLGFRLESRAFWTDTDRADYDWWDDDCCWDDWDGNDDMVQGTIKAGLIISF